MLEINATESVREGSIFGQISTMDHEQLVVCHDQATGLKALIGIHNTVLGPAWEAQECGLTPQKPKPLRMSCDSPGA